MKFVSFASACFFGVIAISSTAFAWLPDWAVPVVASGAKINSTAPAIVLLDQTECDVSGEGVVTETRHLVVRVNESAGAERALGRVDYNGKTGRVRSAGAWLTRGGKVVLSKDKTEWLDLSSTANGTLFDEMRFRTISFSDQAGPNDIAVFETVTEEPRLVAQSRYSWAGDLPCEQQSIRITVPPGFSIESFMHGSPQPDLEKSSDGRSWTWTLRHQPWNRSEPAAPAFSALAADLLVRVIPPANSAFRPATFASWSDLEKWEQTLCAGTCDRSQKLTDDAIRLVKDAPDALGKIRALARTVQMMRYVEVNSNLGQGDGMKPRKASEVYGRGYGDCKDKANLLCALLREVGIQGWEAIACADENMPIWPEFPSPVQFNHAIVAIEVDASVQLPSVVEYNGKRLLFFDATDEFTQVGDLPKDLQGTYVQVVSANFEGLIKLPQIPAATGFMLDRKIAFTLSPTGAVTGQATISGLGQEGAYLRYQHFKNSQPDAVQRHLEAAMTNQLRGSHFTEGAKTDDLATGRCSESFSLSQAKFLQAMPGNLALAHLNVFAQHLPNFSAHERRYPVRLWSQAESDEVSIELPAGFSTAEIPQDASLKSEYGQFTSHFEVHDHTVIYHRYLEISAQMVPVEDYAKVKKFFTDIAKANKAPLILKTAASVAAVP